MAKLLSYPHFIINVDDQSSYDGSIVFEQMPLHVPHFFIRAASGTPNVPMYYDEWNAVTRSLGKETFDRLTPYFTRDSLFVEECFKQQPGFITRLVPDDSMTATALVEANVFEDVDIVQYERDSFGGFKLDESGAPIPMLDETNQPITNKGIKIKFTSRTIDPETESKVTTIKPREHVMDGKNVTTFPIVACTDIAPGEPGNRKGFRLYYDYSVQQVDRLEANKALTFSFTPLNRDYSSDIPIPVRNRWNQVYSEFMLKPNQVDNKIMMKISWDDVLENNYVQNKASELPFNIHFFTDYIKLIGEKIVAVESDDNVYLTDPWLVDIFSAKDLDGNPYYNFVLDNGNGVMYLNKNYNIYLSGGDDGDTSSEAFQDLMRQFLECKTYPKIKDSARYPITHLYDTGFSIKTKESMLAFLGYRRDVRVELTTQDCDNELNNEQEDLSTGLYLRNRALLQVESSLYGTDCFRCGIYCHAGTINDSTYKSFIPATLDILKKRCYFQKGTYISGEPKGLPYSEINIFKSLNWVAFDEDNKQLFWDTGLNYVQHYDRVSLHWPDLRTVYTNDTSVLSETTYADAIVYAKHVIRRTWAIFTGRTDPAKELFAAIEKVMSDALQKIFNTRYPFTVRAWRNEEEQKLGFVTHITLIVEGRNGNRVHDIDLICTREGYVKEA